MRETTDKKEQGSSPATILGQESPNSGTRNLRNLLALAAALRRLAQDADPREATLYLSAAAMLHQRAEKLAGLRPCGPNSQERSQHPGPRKRIDIHI